MNESKAVTVIPAGGSLPATMENAPAVVLAEAQKAATALRDIIARKPKAVTINGEQYLEFEDWQTVGRFYGITVGTEGEPEHVEIAGAKGFKATSVALLRGGEIISRATAFCMDDEERWAKAPTYQVASMAQTRANAKALRNVLSWVAVLAGYKPTPAEEMDGVRQSPGAAPRKAQGGPRAAGNAPCPDCGESAQPSKFPKPTATHYCYKCKLGFVPKAKTGPQPPAEPIDVEGIDEGYADQYDPTE